MSLKEGSIFGERALIEDKPRAATIITCKKFINLEYFSFESWGVIN
jgi:hypothetical protein